MGNHSLEAVQLLADLDAELAASGRRRGRTLSWSAADRTLLELVANTVDVIGDLESRYALKGKDQLRVATELRLTRQALARLVGMVKTDVPEPKTVTSVKAQRAAHVRWDRERERNAAG